MAEIIMPKMGDAMTEGKVLRWYKKAGDAVKKGDPVAEIGPGALLGERALIEGGKRTATIWAKTPIRVVVVPTDAIDESALPEIAASHRREDS